MNLRMGLEILFVASGMYVIGVAVILFFFHSAKQGSQLEDATDQWKALNKDREE